MGYYYSTYPTIRNGVQLSVISEQVDIIPLLRIEKLTSFNRSKKSEAIHMRGSFALVSYQNLA